MWVAVADASHRDSGDEIDVPVAVLVVEAAAAAAGHREARVESEGLEARRHVAALVRADLPGARPDVPAPRRLRHSGTPISTWPRTRAARYEAMRSEAVSRYRAKLGQAFRSMTRT